MKHRIGIASSTYLGSGAVGLISGKNTSSKVKNSLLKRIAKDCYNTFSFEKFGYCDAGFDGNQARFGVEPAYQFDPLKMIVIHKNKEESQFVTGRAVGVWGSRIISKNKRYDEYLRNSKFTKFVDKWHDKIFPSP